MKKSVYYPHTSAALLLFMPWLLLTACAEKPAVPPSENAVVEQAPQLEHLKPPAPLPFAEISLKVNEATKKGGRPEFVLTFTNKDADEEKGPQKKIQFSSYSLYAYIKEAEDAQGQLLEGKELVFEQQAKGCSSFFNRGSSITKVLDGLGSSSSCRVSLALALEDRTEVTSCTIHFKLTRDADRQVLCENDLTWSGEVLKTEAANSENISLMLSPKYFLSERQGKDNQVDVSFLPTIENRTDSYISFKDLHFNMKYSGDLDVTGSANIPSSLILKPKEKHSFMCLTIPFKKEIQAPFVLAQVAGEVEILNKEKKLIISAPKVSPMAVLVHLVQYITPGIVQKLSWDAANNQLRFQANLIPLHAQNNFVDIGKVQLEFNFRIKDIEGKVWSHQTPFAIANNVLIAANNPYFINEGILLEKGAMEKISEVTLEVVVKYEGHKLFTESRTWLKKDISGL